MIPSDQGYSAHPTFLFEWRNFVSDASLKLSVRAFVVQKHSLHNIAMPQAESQIA